MAQKRLKVPSRRLKVVCVTHYDTFEREIVECIGWHMPSIVFDHAAMRPLRLIPEVSFPTKGHLIISYLWYFLLK